MSDSAAQDHGPRSVTSLEAGSLPDNQEGRYEGHVISDRWFVKINGKRLLVTANSPESALTLGIYKHGVLSKDINKIEVERVR